MSLDKKSTAFIVKLNKLTSQGKILWSVENPPRSIISGTDDHIPLFVTTEYKGQKFALYQHRYKSFDGDAWEHYWNESIVLALIDGEGRVLWEERSPYSALFDLFETVRRRISNIDDVIDALLSDDEEASLPLPH